ncbi:hypothetical protein [Gryllotalpicola koreensis]|uniref:Major capsid protein n=1 Tax=Gryllotalpicola koreensis TaxID=993086 RepID=A0ABP8A1Y4_9MICO
MTTFVGTIQYRQDTAAHFAAKNAVYAVGEPTYETDTKKTKIGDGVTPYNDLPYSVPDSAAFATAAQGAKADDALPAASLDSATSAILSDPESESAASLNATIVAVGSENFVVRGRPVKAKRFRTTVDGVNHMAQTEVTFGDVAQVASPVVVSPAERYQEFLGFGAALTDSSAYLLNQMTESDRTALLTELFSPQQRNWSAVRISFGSCDFRAADLYTYADNGGTADPTLASFSIARDMDYIIPVLKQILAINPNVKVFASIWNWPAWMQYATAAPSGLTATGATTGGTLPAGSYSYKVAAIYESENVTKASTAATGLQAAHTSASPHPLGAKPAFGATIPALGLGLV